jgi:hypothetical protein
MMMMELRVPVQAAWFVEGFLVGGLITLLFCLRVGEKWLQEELDFLRTQLKR